MMRFVTLAVLLILVGAPMARAVSPDVLDLLASHFAGRSINVLKKGPQPISGWGSTGANVQTNELYLSPELWNNMVRMPKKRDWMSPLRTMVFVHELGHLVKGVGNPGALTTEDEKVANRWAENHIFNVAMKLGMNRKQAGAFAKQAKKDYRGYYADNPDIFFP